MKITHWIKRKVSCVHFPPEGKRQTAPDKTCLTCKFRAGTLVRDTYHARWCAHDTVPRWCAHDTVPRWCAHDTVPRWCAHDTVRCNINVAHDAQ